jgi:hypothetical protein
MSNDPINDAPTIATIAATVLSINAAGAAQDAAHTQAVTLWCIGNET